MVPTTVKLGKHEVTLVKPSPLFSLALPVGERAEAAAPSEIFAAGAAALAASWPHDAAWPVPPRPRPWKSDQRVHEYGHPIFDALADRSGAEIGDVVATCAAAYLHAAAMVFATKEQVESAKDFSEPPEGG